MVTRILCRKVEYRFNKSRMGILRVRKFSKESWRDVENDGKRVED